MSQWLKLLPLELDSIKAEDYIEPSLEPEEGEVVLGEASDYTKKVFTLNRMIVRDINREIADAMSSGNPNELEALASKRHEMNIKAEMLDKMMWISICDDFGSWDYEGTGLRKGFLVVNITQRPKNWFGFRLG